jgi:hypothetical protein
MMEPMAAVEALNRDAVAAHGMSVAEKRNERN